MRKSEEKDVPTSEAVPSVEESPADLTPEPAQAHLNVIIYQFEEDSALERSLVTTLQDYLDENVKTARENTTIDVWLNSPGGDAHVAYKLMLDLRNRAHIVNGIVVDYAKSAATLFLLGVDAIYMAPAAELGPLDVQIPHPDRENVQISGLDSARAISQLASQAVDMVLASGPKMLRYTGLTRSEVLHESLQFMAEFLRPTVGKLDPHLIHRAVNQLKVAERYARVMLENRNSTHVSPLDAPQVDIMLRKLVNGYPAHGFVISRAEALAMGLPIKNAEDHPLWEAGKGLHAFARNQRIDLIGAFTNDEIVGMTSSVENNSGEAS